MDTRGRGTREALGASLLAIVAAACGDRGGDPAPRSTPRSASASAVASVPRAEVVRTPDAPGFERSSDGRLFRVGPSSCAEPPPGGCSLGPADASGNQRVGPAQCKTDADCSSAPHGRCTTQQRQIVASNLIYEKLCACAYPCTVDSECGAGNACYCAPGKAGQCIHADCLSDADCKVPTQEKDGTCEASGVDNKCGELLEVHCKPSTAACHSDADCAPRGETRTRCTYERPDGWQCRAEVCAIPGRPFLVDGVATWALPLPRADWSRPPGERLDGLSIDERARVARRWLDAAALEHASIASFARFALELLALGAPSELVRRAHRAALDEIRHAQASWSLARRYGAAPTGPASLAVGSGPVSRDVERVVRGLVLDGCVGESVAAAEAMLLSALAASDDVRDTLAGIARDELDHAALAFDALDWIERTHGGRAVRAREAAIAEARATLVCAAGEAPVDPSPMEAHGALGATRAAELRRRVLEEAVRSALPAPPARSTPRAPRMRALA